MKIVIVIALLAVLVALGSAGVFMLRRPRKEDASQPADKRMARALAVRVGLSVAIFLLVLLAWKMGWIVPKGLPTGR
jgi:putative copper export protein